MNKVELIKLGQFVGGGLGDKSIILLVEEDDPTTSYYLSIFKKYCESNSLATLKTAGGVVRPSGSTRFSGFHTTAELKHISGVSDGSPAIGHSFTVNGGTWGTSKVVFVVNDNIFITSNSIYAIHSKSDMRDQKLNKLGI